MASQYSHEKNNKICNKNYDSDINYTLQMTKWLLTPLGLWLLLSKDPKRNEIWMSVGVILISATPILWVIIPCTRHLAFIEQDHTVQLTKLGPLIYCYKTILLHITIILCTSRIKDCINHIRQDWQNLKTDEDRNIMLKNINVGRKITVICGVFIHSGGLSYHSIMQLLSGNKLNKINETLKPHVFPGYDDFVNSQRTPAYEVIFIAQFITGIVECVVTTATCNLTAIVVAHAVGQIEIVMARVKEIVSDNDKYNAKPETRIATVIKGHDNVLRLTVEIEKVLKNVCLVEIFGSATVMCLAEYNLIKEWHNSETIACFTLGMLCISLSFNIFLFCYISELLTQRSSDFGELAYMINWYRLPGKSSLPLSLIIAIANSPKRLSAGGLLELSMASFTQIMKTSVVYLNLLYTMES